MQIINLKKKTKEIKTCVMLTYTSDFYANRKRKNIVNVAFKLIMQSLQLYA